MHPFALLLSLPCLASLVFAQGAVHQVSPTGPISDVQTAIDAASNGDVIEVAPGAYPAFAVAGKQLSIIGIDPTSNAPATFSVTGAANTPAIRIEYLTTGQLVTVSGARIHHTNTTAPAIVIADNATASVRLLDCVVTTLTVLGSVPYDGVVEVRDTYCVWLVQVRVGDHRVFANGAGGATGLAALLADESQLHLDRCDCRGMRSADANVAGGDGLRTTGATTAWMVDSILMGGMSSAGAVPGTLGGHPVHDFDGAAGIITACDCMLTPAVSTVSLFAVSGATSFLAACSGDTIGRTSLSPPSTALSIGTSTTVLVSANTGNRAFLLLISDGFGHAQVPGLFHGALLFGSNVVSLAGGLLGAAPSPTPLHLPMVPAGIGLQFSLQSVMLAPGSAPWSLSMTTAAAFTVR